MIRERGYKSKKCRHIKLTKIEVEGNGRNAAIIFELKNTGKQDEESRMNGKSGNDIKRLAGNNE